MVVDTWTKPRVRAAPLPEGLQQCLADRSATPVHFIDVDAIAAEASAMKAAFDGAFADCAIAYSYKNQCRKVHHHDAMTSSPRL